MHNQPLVQDDREYKFNDRHFQFFANLIKQEAGIHLSINKRELVYSRLTRRIRNLGISGYDEYCALLRKHPEQEISHFVNAITTNLTSFFREKHHFDFLAKKILPPLLEKSGRCRVRIWSAGCSTGEEPYSLAIAAQESLSAAGVCDFKILATDIDSNVIRHGQAGIYDINRIDDLPKAITHRWFKRGQGDETGKVSVDPILKKYITFKTLNLMADWPFSGPFDLIICRNVVIYFDKSTQKRLFDRYAEYLNPAGYLIVGHSENLVGVTDRFELIGRTIYRRIR